MISLKTKKKLALTIETATQTLSLNITSINPNDCTSIPKNI